MSVWWLVLLMPVAFIGVLLWRRKITRDHNAFKLKMDLATDEDHARQKIQAYYNRKNDRNPTNGKPDGE